MNGARVDRISNLFAARRRESRRARGATAAGAVAAGLGSSLARDATREPATLPVTTGDGDEKVQYLFVQSYSNGTIAATNEPGRYTVTLEGGVGQTVYFANRPSRDVGVSPTDQFVEGLGFSEDNPPNAALVLEVEPGDQDIAVVELYNPTIDPRTNAVTYDIAPLANWEQTLELGFQETTTDLADLVPEFGAAHVFIDDCADQNVWCERYHGFHPPEIVAPLGRRGFCWDVFGCVPCRDYSRECDLMWPEYCEYKCHANWECGPLCF